MTVFARFLGVVGHHEDSFPVEKLDVNNSGELVASISHDNRSAGVDPVVWKLIKGLFDFFVKIICVTFNIVPLSCFHSNPLCPTLPVLVR